MTRFKHFRLQMCLSQQQVASLMHLSRRTYGKYERGDRIPDLKFYAAFSQAMHIPLRELMDDHDMPQPIMPISSEEEHVLLLFRNLDGGGKSYIFEELLREESLIRSFSRENEPALFTDAGVPSEDGSSPAFRISFPSLPDDDPR